MNVPAHEVARHYAQGSVEEVILAALDEGGTEGDPVERLAAVDEFHIGGREATAALLQQLDLRAGLRVLDVGCGIGGTARFLASRYGCQVTGVDLTPDYVRAGTTLTRRVGLSERVELRVANALDLPFESGTFDRATLVHVGMNVPDKQALFTEIGRVLRPSAILGVYDVMRLDDGELLFPVPWAHSASLSFVDAPERYRTALRQAGFDLSAETARREFAIDFFTRMKARMAESGLPRLGIHILMGTDAGIKVANMIENVERGRVAPVEMIAIRR